jgi:branched-chain amino acid transport system ATP-binding protein
VLEVDRVSVSYGKIGALDGVSLDVVEGEVFSLIGANGAGKTTLLRSIMGLVKCSEGRVMFAGQDLTRQPPYVRARVGISIVPEGRGLLRQFTVEENLRAGAFPRSDGTAVRLDLERIYRMFERLRERRRQLAGSLSGGEGQMLALARALMSRPKLLLMDEPSMGLMPTMVDEIFQHIAALRSEGISVLLVEQNARKALRVADRVAAMQLGRITVRGTPSELLEDSRVKQAYFGGGQLG